MTAYEQRQPSQFSVKVVALVPFAFCLQSAWVSRCSSLLHSPCECTLLHLLQGIDTASAEPQLVYVCAGMEVPPDATPDTAAVEAAAAPGIAAAPDESLAGSSPADPDPAVDRVWTLASRPAATNKIW
jgi:hypothetical protein